jgi:RNA polymerase sigma factor (sigma-70 family)
VSTIATSCRVTEENAEAVACGGTRPKSAFGGTAIETLAADFDRLHATVYRYLLHRFFDPELAEELTAQTFYNAAVYISRLDSDIRQIRVWLLRAATNLANTHYRRQRLRRLFLGRLARENPATTEPESASNPTDGKRRAHVRGVLLALRPKYQTVVVLRYYVQMSFAEIAAVLGCREDAARARLSRAIREMRQRLGSREVCDAPQT